MKKLLLILLFLTSCSPYVATPAAVSPTDTAQATTAPKPTVTPSLTPSTVQVQANSLHVRTSPMKAVIGYAFHGDTLTLTNVCRDGWAQIVWKSATAWVKASYLSENDCQTNKE